MKVSFSGIFGISFLKKGGGCTVGYLSKFKRNETIEVPFTLTHPIILSREYHNEIILELV